MTVPTKLTGELACILEDCGPPDHQSHEALAELIRHYQPTWDRVVAALTLTHQSAPVFLTPQNTAESEPAVMSDSAGADTSAVAWQFRQRSGVGKGPQNQAPWCDWCSIEREDYEMYIRAPNPLIQVRPLYAALAATPEPQGTWSDGGKVWEGEPATPAVGGEVLERARCIAICECWIGTFQDREIKYTSAREYAVDAIEDIIDLIRDGHKTAAPPSSGGHSQFHHVTQDEKDMCPTCAAQPASPLPGKEPVAWIVGNIELNYSYMVFFSEESAIEHYNRSKNVLPAWAKIEPVYAAPPASPLRGRYELAEFLCEKLALESFDSLSRAKYLGDAKAILEFLAAPPEQPAAGTGRDDVIAECAAIADQYDDCGGSFIAQKIRDLYSSTKSSSGDKEDQAWRDLP